MSVLKRWNGSDWEKIGPAIENIQYNNINNIIASGYDPTATYVIGDLVIYNNKLYKCVSEITTAEAWTAAHWNETNIGAEISNIILKISS